MPAVDGFKIAQHIALPAIGAEITQGEYDRLARLLAVRSGLLDAAFNGQRTAAQELRAQATIECFKGQAAKAGIELPVGLEAGFSQYASGGAIPVLDHVPRLSRQLYSVEKVADVLIQSEVASIERGEVFAIVGGGDEADIC